MLSKKTETLLQETCNKHSWMIKRSWSNKFFLSHRENRIRLKNPPTHLWFKLKIDNPLIHSGRRFVITPSKKVCMLRLIDCSLWEIFAQLNHVFSTHNLYEFVATTLIQLWTLLNFKCFTYLILADGI